VSELLSGIKLGSTYSLEASLEDECCWTSSSLEDES
jgi:hypothetical protein